jgi:hypothetical protein
METPAVASACQMNFKKLMTLFMTFVMMCPLSLITTPEVDATLVDHADCFYFEGTSAQDPSAIWRRGKTSTLSTADMGR